MRRDARLYRNDTKDENARAPSERARALTDGLQRVSWSAIDVQMCWVALGTAPYSLYRTVTTASLWQNLLVPSVFAIILELLVQ